MSRAVNLISTNNRLLIEFSSIASRSGQFQVKEGIGQLTISDGIGANVYVHDAAVPDASFAGNMPAYLLLLGLEEGSPVWHYYVECRDQALLLRLLAHWRAIPGVVVDNDFGKIFLIGELDGAGMDWR